MRLWTTEVVNYYKLFLVIHVSRNFEHNNAETNVDYRGPAQQGSDRNNISNWDRDFSFSTLVKNVADLCPYPKNMPEAKLKCIEFNSLAKEISRQTNIDFDAWSLIITLMQNYNEKDHSGQTKIQNYSLRKKGVMENLMLEPTFTLKEKTYPIIASSSK